MQRVWIVLKGMGMGFADVIPGVSGGTIALIVGIYVQFIEAIKSVNFRWVMPLLRWVASGFSRDKRDPVMEPILSIHWGFLVPLGAGIVLAFGIGSVVVPYLMDVFPRETAAFFIGLILASIIVPYRQMTDRRWTHMAVALVATVITFGVVGSKAEPALTWTQASHAEDIDLEHFMREYPSVRNAEQLYCPTGTATDNAALRNAVAADPDQPGVGARLDQLCAQISANQDDLTATAALREVENLGRKHPDNPFNGLTVPAGTQVQIPRPAIWYVFLAGVIGICAMVLPGISGSFFLLVLGVYHFMLSSALKGFIGHAVHLEFPQTQALYVMVFCIGCLIGLLSFARVMSTLFTRFPSGTLAALIGMMLGSLRALWPWKIGEPHTGVQNVLPALDASLAGPVAACAVGFALVALISWLGVRFGRS